MTSVEQSYAAGRIQGILDSGWQCGDCGNTYDANVDACPNRLLDEAHAAARAADPTSRPRPPQKMTPAVSVPGSVADAVVAELERLADDAIAHHREFPEPVEQMRASTHAKPQPKVRGPRRPRRPRDGD